MSAMAENQPDQLVGQISLNEPSLETAVIDSKVGGISSFLAA